MNECPTGAIALKGMEPLPKESKAPAAKPEAKPAAAPASQADNKSVNEQK